MTHSVHFRIDQASQDEIKNHLQECNLDFLPLLSDRVDLDGYAAKITENATRFEAWSENILIGLLAVYCNDPLKKNAYITNVSVLRNWSRQGIASQLLNDCLDHIGALNIKNISLEVGSENIRAIAFYKKAGFFVEREKGSSTEMRFIHDKQ